MVKPLTAAEFRQSVAEDFSAAVESTCQDLIKAAVLAEREACAQVCEGRNRDGDWFAAEIRARSQA